MLLSTHLKLPAPPKAKKICEFDYATLEDLVYDYYDQMDGRSDAKLTIVDNILTLSIYDKDDSRFQVYHSVSCPELYELIDSNYIDLIKNASISNDYWDRWQAMIIALTPCQIVDEQFFEP